MYKLTFIGGYWQIEKEQFVLSIYFYETEMRVTNLLRTIVFTVTSIVGSLTIAAQELAPLAEAEWITGNSLLLQHFTSI